METLLSKGQQKVGFQRQMDYQRQKKWLGVLFSLPALVLLFTFLVLPVILAFIYSFMEYNMLNPDAKSFNGIENYKRLFQDMIFLKALKNTMYFTALVVPLQCGVALVLALLVNKKVKVASLGRVFFFSPVVTSMVVVAILWTFLYNVNNGLINNTLNFFGIANQPFLLSEDQAMNSIIFMSIWQAAGFQMMIFLAGLKEVPDTLYEAADIDGANAWQKFCKGGINDDTQYKKDIRENRCYRKQVSRKTFKKLLIKCKRYYNMAIAITLAWDMEMGIIHSLTGKVYFTYKVTGQFQSF